MKFGGRLDAALGAIGAVVIFGMMALTFVDVIMRYVFNRSLRGAFEVTELMMVILIYAGLPVVSRLNLHVSTDLLDSQLTPALRRASDTINHLIVAAALFGAGWLIWIKAGRAAQLNDMTAALKIPLAPFAYLMCALILVTGVIHLVKAFSPADSNASEIPSSAL